MRAEDRGEEGAQDPVKVCQEMKRRGERMGKAGTLYPAQILDSKTLRPLIPAHEECRGGACILTTHSFMEVAVQR